MNRKYIFTVFIFLFLVLFISNVYSSSSNLIVTQRTFADKEPNTFYISRYTEKEIFFNISSDYTKRSTVLREPYLQVSLEVLDSSPNIYFSKSVDKAYFTSNLNTSFTLRAIPNNYADKTTRVVLTYTLFDEFDNLLNTQKSYFYFVANNSEIQYLTETGAKPEFIGYTMSEKLLSFSDINQSFVVDVHFYVSSYDGYVYDLVCEHPEQIKTRTVIGSKGDNKLIVSLDSTKEFKDSRYLIHCFAKDKYDKYTLKPISVFIDSQDIYENSASDVYETPKKSITGNLNLSNLWEFNFKTILIGIIVILLFVIVFSKK